MKKKTKEDLIERLATQLSIDVSNGDVSVLEELLGFIPVKNLIGGLAEEEWKDYKHLEQKEATDKAVEAASHYLSDGDISTKKMVEAIAKHEDQSDLIDNVDGVVVWQKVEGSFTCEEFLKEIN